jgi:dTDP-4-amino-4,6-dideoxygalactose transaminase
VSTSNGKNSIPFLDLVTPHVEMEQELTAIFHRVLHTAGFIGGPMVEEFEKAFAAFCGVSHSIAISSGTDALRFAIMACGVQPGDVVVTVPHTFIATTEAISQAGALPEFVDIDERTYNMDPEKLREYLEEDCTADKSGKLVSRRSGRPVTAVVPVHYTDRWWTWMRFRNLRIVTSLPSLKMPARRTAPSIFRASKTDG